jgi:uncharacterized protein (DUF2147 family)
MGSNAAYLPKCRPKLTLRHTCGGRDKFRIEALMKNAFASAAILALMSSGAAAADPTGDWLVKDGYAHIRIDDCGGKMWGIVAWEKEPGVDKENPDRSKQGRPTLGMPILLGMKPTRPNLWEGEIYNSTNGKTYDARISMVNENTLKLEGCVLGFLCGGENWTRVTTAPTAGNALPPARTSVKASMSKGASKGQAQSDVCTRVAMQSAPASAVPTRSR